MITVTPIAMGIATTDTESTDTESIGAAKVVVAIIVTGIDTVTTVADIATIMTVGIE
jgi:hypothetical protein